MATSDEIGAGQLPAFSATQPFEQLAIELKSEGKEYDKIVNTLNAEFGLELKQRRVREWFHAGGRLEQAYLEYNQWYADQTVASAKIKIKKLSGRAADTLGELMDEAYDSRVRRQAASDILKKYVPDRQVVIDDSSGDELPPSIGDAGDEVIAGIAKKAKADKQEKAKDGQVEVADAPQGEEPGPKPGA
jgi:hypothetical protein